MLTQVYLGIICSDAMLQGTVTLDSHLDILFSIPNQTLAVWGGVRGEE